MKSILFILLLIQSTTFANRRLDALSTQELKMFDKELDAKGESFSLWTSKYYPRLLAYKYFLDHPITDLQNLSAQQLEKRVNLKAKEIASEFPTADEFYASESKTQIFTNKIYKKYGENIFGNELPINSNLWMLTIDDGPSSQYTQKFLDAFKDQNIKASFFIVAKRALENKQLVFNEIQDGHMVANHSYTHADLSIADDSVLKREITQSTSVLRENFGYNAFDFFRCPKGAGYKKENVKSYFKANKLVHVRWNVDSNDWKYKDNPSLVVSTVLKQMKNQKQRGIILFHDIHKNTLSAVLQVIKQSPQAKWLRVDDIYVTEPLNN